MAPGIRVLVHLDAFKGELAELVELLRARIQRGTSQGLRRLQTYIVDEELAGQLLKRRTRTLIRSVHLEPAVYHGDELVGAVTAGGGLAWYARLHEYGTASSFTIRARRAKALRFTVGGQMRFAKSVTHPPFRATAFMRRGLQAQRDQIVASIRAALQESRT